MVKSLLLAASGRAVADQFSVKNWWPVTKHVVELPSTFDPVSFGECLDLCVLSNGLVCEGFSFHPVDSQKGTCTHHRFDKKGALSDVFAYFPIVDLAKVLPETNYTYTQVGEPKSVTGLDQCRDVLTTSSVSSLEAVFANFGNQACGTEQRTPTATILDGKYLEKEVLLVFEYLPPAEGLGVAAPQYLTLVSTGFKMEPQLSDASYWTWSNGGVRSTVQPNVCLSAQDELTPIYLDNSQHSRCAGGQRAGSPFNKTDLFGWVMQNTTKGPFKCMGDIKKGKGGYDLIAIEEPDVKTNLCNRRWKVAGKQILKNNPVLVSRQCDVGAFDGAWVDGPSYPPGDFSREWFDTLTISSDDNTFNAHTAGGDSNTLFPISIDGCSITVYLKKGCNDCIATGTLSQGGETINWDSGFNDGDYWMRKNQGCCTVYDATLKKSPSSLVSPTPEGMTSPTDAACSEHLSGRWEDRTKGDFNYSWGLYMDLSAGRPEDEVADDTNARMTAPIDQGSWVLPAKFFEESGKCKLKLCLQKQCPDEAYAIGTLDIDEIHWDERLNNGKWVRFADNFCINAVSNYSCCDATPQIGCAFAPNKKVCDDVNGTFCCDPLQPYLQCGFEPSTTTQTLTLV